MKKREYTGIIGEEMARKRNRVAFLTSFATSYVTTRCAMSALRQKQMEEQERRKAEQDAYVNHMMGMLRRQDNNIK